jgi:hypothetical protein
MQTAGITAVYLLAGADQLFDRRQPTDIITAVRASQGESQSNGVTTDCESKIW